MRLLPPNASAAERALDASCARLGTLDVPLRALWNPDTCPRAHLPWLAWALSVDVWDPAWSEAQQRAALRASFFVHQRKGTIGAVKANLAALDWTIEVIEWFDDDAQGGASAYTFRIEAELDARGIAAGLYDEIERLAIAAKNVRSHLTRISLLSRLPGAIVVGCALVAAEIVEVQPFQISDLSTAARVGVVAVVMAHEFVTLTSEVS